MTSFLEYLWNSKWEFSDYLEWNLFAWAVLWFRVSLAPVPNLNNRNERLYPPNFLDYIIECILVSVLITVFYWVGWFFIFLKSLM
jgi:hypothetical protein